MVAFTLGKVKCTGQITKGQAGFTLLRCSFTDEKSNKEDKRCAFVKERDGSVIPDLGWRHDQEWDAVVETH